MSRGHVVRARVWTTPTISPTTIARTTSGGSKRESSTASAALVLIGAVVTLIVHPAQGRDHVIIHPHSAAPTVAPTPGGAVLGGAWSF